MLLLVSTEDVVFAARLRRELERGTVAVDVYLSITQAKEALLSGRYDRLILDWDQSATDAPDLLTWLRAEPMFEHFPVLAVVSPPMPESVVFEIYQMGGDMVLDKTENLSMLGR